jgi:hypothetical protein
MKGFSRGGGMEGFIGGGGRYAYGRMVGDKRYYGRRCVSASGGDTKAAITTTATITNATATTVAFAVTKEVPVSEEPIVWNRDVMRLLVP